MMSKKVHTICSIIIALITVGMAFVSSSDMFDVELSVWIILTPAIVFNIITMLIVDKKKENE